MTKKKNSYTDEFKQNAVELSKELGILKAAQELGVSEMSIRNWQKKILSSTSSSRKSETDLLKENKRLQKEVQYLKKINDVLKKSTAIFSQDEFPPFK